MILPCRIHRARTRNCVDSLPLALALRRFFARSATETDSGRTSRRSGRFDVARRWRKLAAKYSTTSHYGQRGRGLRLQRRSHLERRRLQSSRAETLVSLMTVARDRHNFICPLAAALPIISMRQTLQQCGKHVQRRREHKPHLVAHA